MSDKTVTTNDWEKVARECYWAFVTALPYVEVCQNVLSKELAKELRETRDKYEKTF